MGSKRVSREDALRNAVKHALEAETFIDGTEPHKAHINESQMWSQIARTMKDCGYMSIEVGR